MAVTYGDLGRGLGHGAVHLPHLPLISMVNRMIVVQYDDFDGRRALWCSSRPCRPGPSRRRFHDNLVKTMEKIPLGMKVAEAVMLRYYNEPGDVLDTLGLVPEDIDFCTFDHLHVQDPRMILGSTSVIPGETEPRKPLFGDAKMLVHTRELATLESLHPMQWAWYIEHGLDGVDPDSFARFDGDIELGPGIALLWTPGHTDGNHSLVLNTPHGVWVSS